MNENVLSGPEYELMEYSNSKSVQKVDDFF